MTADAAPAPSAPSAPAAARTKAPAGLVTLIVVQAFCAVFFLADLAADFMETGGRLLVVDPHLVIEAVATLSLVAAIAIELRVLVRLARREARLRENLSMAQAAVHEVIEEEFRAWKLSPSERDVANFLVKGMSISETAALRGSAEGTIKAHLNGIYRKAGVQNRAEMMSVLIDAIMGRESENGAAGADMGTDTVTGEA